MQSWDEIRLTYPNQWVLVEALNAETVENRRQIHSLRVLAPFDDFPSAWMGYLTHHRAAPQRELYMLHTRREQLNIEVVQQPIGTAFRR